MAVVTTELGRKDIISQTRGKYYVKYVWVLDQKTLKPVGVRVIRVYS